MKGIFTTPSPTLRDNKDETHHQTKTVGCMPGIFNFFHRHNHRYSRKRLTYGKKEKKAKRSSIPDAKTRTIKASAATSTVDKIVTLKRAGSADISRSETIEFREMVSSRMSPTPSAKTPRMGSTESMSSPEIPRKAPALVARLMGLDDIPVCSPTLSTAEKRRKLLGALERCDEDVKVLNQIIDAVRSSQALAIVTTKEEKYLTEKKVSSVQELLSPVSVINAIRCSPPSPVFRPEDKKTVIEKKTAMEEWRINRIKADIRSATWLQLRGSMEGHPSRGGGGGGGRRCSKTNSERSEVWKDGGIVERMRWEELGKVVVELEGDIFLDLMDETVKELDLCFSTSVGGGGGGDAVKAAHFWSLPLDACRRRLRF